MMSSHSYPHKPSAAIAFLSMASTSSADIGTGFEPQPIRWQREAAYAKAEELNMNLVGEFVEIGAPATSLAKRPALQQMLAFLAEHPDVESVIFPSMGRFARSQSHGLTLRDDFRQLGVAVIFSYGTPDRLAAESSAPHDITPAWLPDLGDEPAFREHQHRTLDRRKRLHSITSDHATQMRSS